MKKSNIQEAISLYEEILATDMTEGLFEIMDEILKEDPNTVNTFIERFHHPIERDNREILCKIILKQIHFQPAIDFLKNECGWDDFTGFAGFPES